MAGWADTLLNTAPDFREIQATRLERDAGAMRQQQAGQQAWDFQNKQHQAALMRGAQELIKAGSDPRAWAALQQRHPDLGPYEQRQSIIQAATDAIDPTAAASRRQSQANSDRSYALDVSRMGQERVPAGYRKTADGNLEPIPGGPASGGKTANAPLGYRWGADGQSLEAIPGGPAEKMPAELAARTGMSEEFLRQLPGLKPDIAAGAATGPVDYLAGQLGVGRAGEIHRRLASGADALLRGLTGAGMAIAEAEKYVARYQPRITDSAEVLADKVAQLEAELTSIRSVASRGRGGMQPSASPPPAPAPAAPPPQSPRAGTKFSDSVFGGQAQAAPAASALPPGTYNWTPDGGLAR